MQDDSTLDKIRDFADRAHADQKRKYTPERYIVHPVRVMEFCRQYTNDVTMLSAALLHDVLEDTTVNSSALSVFLHQVMNNHQAAKTLKLVKELTDQYVKARYPSLNRRRRKALELERMEKISPEAQTIKYADIIDNCREIVQHDADFAVVFLNECRILLSKLDKGHPELHKLALDSVKTGLIAVKH